MPSHKYHQHFLSADVNTVLISQYQTILKGVKKIVKLDIMTARDELFSQVPQTLLKPERQTSLGDQHTSLG